MDKRIQFQKNQIALAKSLAQKRKGICLSKSYLTAKTKLHWQCNEGHKWHSILDNIKKGSWCPTCAGKAKLSIDLMKQIANERGGRCLSTEYRNHRDILIWECGEKHTWRAKAGHVRHGSWCPECEIGINERMTRKIFELLFNTQFPKIRPDWLRIKKSNLELDGYSELLKIAFEYQGRQHYEDVPSMESSLSKRIEHDEFKRMNCKLHDVTLVEIPYTVKQDDLENFIRSECNKNEIKVPRETAISKQELQSAYLSKSEAIIELQKVAKQKNGLFLSTAYEGAARKHLWKCDKGHEWLAAPALVKRGSWCPKCAYIKKTQLISKTLLGTIEAMQLLAQEKNGLCLSKKYVNYTTKLDWKCSNGHKFKASPTSVKRGNWCPFCSGKRKTIADMQTAAKKMNGKCLSDQYRGANTKLKWQCESGHVWEAAPSTVVQGHWCPKCAKAKAAVLFRGSIDTYQAIAKARGGTCLSTEFVNAKIPLKWQCKMKHTWTAKPYHVKAGSWCPTCSKNLSASKLRNSIEDMQRIALSRNGRCLSKKYVNGHNHLLWECHNGHTWKAIPSNVKRGSWCPHCRKKN